jgi:Tol biopolymer transport system component
MSDRWSYGVFSPCLLLVCALTLAGTSMLRAQEEEKKAKKKWDVTAEHGPVKTVSFTTTEGTWKNLDVSPDGREIVFDLLGDIYLMPIGGGKARRLTSGPAYDVQPRFDPDGSRISFTSDRAGGDKIWVMQRDGSDPKQTTKEKFRLLNNAAWTPDGHYVVARKHFTSTRSLGAGEMWLYHVSGGGGLQLTKRKNDQQDAGEPDVSPDGRYVFLSEDMSGGSTFQYNKDPNGQIYVIRRLDRETGELTNVITGPGGAVRPRVSPDGRHIAFVRRVRTESVLYLYDRQTGAQWPLFDGLSHDQQEAWAIFGPYPNYAWTPDSREIVFWAQGKIWRIHVGSKEVAEIPFEAEVEQQVTEAVRFPVEVAPQSFETKMIRGAVTSPDGDWLVFEVVGHLWKKRMPRGRPERLTSDDSRFERDAAFSPDGSTVVYTSWNDAELSAIWSVPLRGATATRLTTRPGHYHTPRYSPDGSKIVYRRAAGNILVGFMHGVETGLYWMDAAGGEPHLITKRGTDARFDHTGERIYFRTGGGLSKQYRSIELDGSDERTHFTLTTATSRRSRRSGRRST